MCIPTLARPLSVYDCLCLSKPSAQGRSAMITIILYFTKSSYIYYLTTHHHQRNIIHDDMYCIWYLVINQDGDDDDDDDDDEDEDDDDDDDDGDGHDDNDDDDDDDDEDDCDEDDEDKHHDIITSSSGPRVLNILIIVIVITIIKIILNWSHSARLPWQQAIPFSVESAALQLPCHVCNKQVVGRGNCIDMMSQGHIATLWLLNYMTIMCGCCLQARLSTNILTKSRPRACLSHVSFVHFIRSLDPVSSTSVPPSPCCRNQKLDSYDPNSRPLAAWAVCSVEGGMILWSCHWWQSQFRRRLTMWLVAKAKVLTAHGELQKFQFFGQMRAIPSHGQILLGCCGEVGYPNEHEAVDIMRIA